jgi:hypothetical protein
MRPPPRTFLLVRAKLDENDVPYLVADPSMPARRVGIRRVEKAPAQPGHFGEHFEPHPHVHEVTDIRHLAHFRSEAAAGTLEILGQCQARDLHEAAQKLQPPAPTTARTGALPPAESATPTKDAAPAASE